MAWLYLGEGWPRDAQIRFLVLLGTCVLLAIFWIRAQRGKLAAHRALVVVQMELRETRVALDEEVRWRVSCRCADQLSGRQWGWQRTRLGLISYKAI